MLPPRLQIKELMAQNPDPPTYIIDGLLALKGLSLLVAHPKAGKSTFVRSLLTKVARSEDFLGRKIISCPILYYILEEPVEHVVEEFRRIGITNELIFARAGAIPKEEMGSVVEKDIAAINARLIVIDPLFDALTIDDTNSYGLVNRAMKNLLYVARRTGCHILTVHHTNKSDVRGGLAILGSQALRGSTDCNMFLFRRNDGTRLIETEQRLGTPLEMTSLSFDEKTRMVGIGRSVKEERLEKLEKSLLSVLGDNKLSTTAWRSMVRGNNAEKALIINQLEEKGIVESVMEGKTVMWMKTTPPDNKG